jgi:oligopeptide transport system ATP-binding protein
MATQMATESAPQSQQDTLISLQHVTKQFPIKKGFFNRTVGQIQAVTDVSLDIYRGETLGIVGESGCGKSTLGRCILQLIRPTSGQVLFEGQDLTQLTPGQLRPLRRDMQIVFQNPYSSLDPRMTIGDTIGEPFIIHRIAKGLKLREEVYKLLDLVGLPQSAFGRYPHELSGGQRQRVGIARALALKPKFIVADEPVSALDVSVQAQILNLLMDLKAEFNLTYLFIAHNLSVVEYISDRVAVMYLGQIAEVGPARQIYEKPLHPYTKALLSAISIPDPEYDHSKRILLEGDLPSPANPPSGCRFHTRCAYRVDHCAEATPQLEYYLPEHEAQCFRVRDINQL